MYMFYKLINKKELNNEVKNINVFLKKLERSYKKSPSLYFLRCLTYFLEILIFPYFLEKIFSEYLSSNVIGYIIGFVITLGIYKFSKVLNFTVFKGFSIFYLARKKIIRSFLQSLGILSILLFINILLKYNPSKHYVK